MISKLWIVLLGLLAAWNLASPLSPSWKLVIMAFGIFSIVKLQSLLTHLRKTARVPIKEAAIWLFLVPTLDADVFFGDRLPTSDKPDRSLWMFASAKALLGTLFLFLLAPGIVENYPLVAGWTAITGIVLLLHFGVLELIVLIWRSIGRNVLPLMNRPILATSLSDFWGRRWNTAFRDFAHAHVFRPACRRWNAQAATLASFLFSGLIHELAISFPAGAGYGLPFAYFAIQGIGVFIERAGVKRGWPLRSGFSGWLFAAIFLIPGAAMLFHPPFVKIVIVPIVEGLRTGIS